MGEPVKYFYQGEKNDFIIFVDSADLAHKYKKGDTTIPLIDIVSIYKIFSTRAGGAEGVLDEASKSEISNEFGSSDVDEAIKKILHTGVPKESAGKTIGKIFASHNDSMGGGATAN